MNVHRIALALFLFGAVPISVARCQMTSQDILGNVRIDQRLNERIPLGLEFHDEAGKPVRLEQYFSNQPVIIVLAQYRCPMLCTQVLNGLVQSLKSVPFEVGQHYRIITVGFDAREDASLAAAKKATYVKDLGQSGGGEGWHFLTGDQAAIDALTSAIGFRYVYDKEHDQFAHASGVFVLTPEGKLSRYFYGIDYPPRDLRLALVEASQGKIGSPVDRLLLLCYHYDAATGRYTPSVMAFVRIGGVLTVLVLAGLIAWMWLHERRANQKHKTPTLVG